MSQPESTLQNREGNYDLLRIFSCITVIILHINASFYLGRLVSGTVDRYYMIENVVNFATRFSVPIFVMLSGAFILGNKRNADLGYFYKKSLKKIVLPFIIASLICLLICEVHTYARDESLLTPLKNWVKGDFYNLWYMYMLIDIYFLAPFLVKIKNATTNREFTVLAVVLMLMDVYSQLTSTCNMMYDLGAVAAYVPYFMFGNILYEHNKKLKYSTAVRVLRNLLLFLLCVLVIGLTVYVRRRFNITIYEISPYTSFFSPAAIILSLLIFTLFGSIWVNHDFPKLANLTFYIYLFHTVIYSNMLPLFKFDELLVIPAAVVITFVCALIVSIIFSKFCKKFF